MQYGYEKRNGSGNRRSGKQGVNQISHIANYKQVGLGDVVENTLKKFGVTENRFKSWFNLEECNCKKRKKWLNKLFKWHYKNYKG